MDHDHKLSNAVLKNMIIMVVPDSHRGGLTLITVVAVSSLILIIHLEDEVGLDKRWMILLGTGLSTCWRKVGRIVKRMTR